MTLDYKDISIYFSDNGEGDAVILLHGFLENSTMWKDLIPAISKSHRVVAIDLLGHGQTGCLGYIQTMEMMAEAVDFVLNELRIGKATFIGHSMGGYVSLAFADLFPNRIVGLCLMNSTALPDSDEKQTNRDRAIKAVKQNNKAFVGMAITGLFAEHNRIGFKDIIEVTKNEAYKTSLQGIVAALEGMKIRKDRTHILHDAHFKKMMVIGKKDPVLDYEVLVNHIQGTEVECVVFPDGHMSHIENKEELTYKILQFIEK